MNNLSLSTFSIILRNLSSFFREKIYIMPMMCFLKLFNNLLKHQIFKYKYKKKKKSPCIRKFIDSFHAKKRKINPHKNLNQKVHFSKQRYLSKIKI
jgi:hypothetical protein